MEEKSKPNLVVRIAAIFVALGKFITSWYIAPIWIVALGIFLGQPLWLCIILAIAFGILGSKLW